MKKTVLRKNGLEIAPLTTESKRTTAEVKQLILIDIANTRKKEISQQKGSEVADRTLPNWQNKRRTSLHLHQRIQNRTSCKCSTSDGLQQITPWLLQRAIKAGTNHQSVAITA